MAASSFNHYAEMRAALREMVRQAVVKACEDIQNGAQRRAPVDTGFLRSSIYTVTSKGSTYGQGLKGDRQQQPEIPAAENDTTGYVAVGAEYGIYVEFGASGRPAQPYMVPAAEAVRPSFEQAGQRLQAAFDEVR